LTRIKVWRRMPPYVATTGPDRAGEREKKMITLLSALAVSAAILAFVLRPQPASAHCDTTDGPTAQDGVKSLETGNLAHALKWITPEGEAELRAVFDRARAARDLGPEAKEVADSWFLENLVRIHRAGEGVPYTGMQPTGVALDERVIAADRAVADGSLAPLAGLVPADRLPELEKRFAVVLERRGYDVDDVAAARDYVEAYVHFFKYAEGHDHAHEHAHAH
jgi:hypothetical protein